MQLSTIVDGCLLVDLLVGRDVAAKVTFENISPVNKSNGVVIVPESDGSASSGFAVSDLVAAVDVIAIDDFEDSICSMLTSAEVERIVFVVVTGAKLRIFKIFAN